MSHFSLPMPDWREQDHLAAGVNLRMYHCPLQEFWGTSVVV
jgi:hypothetical protein